MHPARVLFRWIERRSSLVDRQVLRRREQALKVKLDAQSHSICNKTAQEEQEITITLVREGGVASKGHTTGTQSTWQGPSFGPSPIGLVGKLPLSVFSSDALCSAALKCPKLSCCLKLRLVRTDLYLILCAQRMLCVLQFQTLNRKNIPFSSRLSLICRAKKASCNSP